MLPEGVVQQLKDIDILIYQEIFKREIENIRLRREISGLSMDEIFDIFRKPVNNLSERVLEESLEKLINERWIIKYNNKYITRHGLLIKNVINLRWVSIYEYDGEERYVPTPRQIIDYSLEEPKEIIIQLPTVPIKNSEGVRDLLISLGVSIEHLHNFLDILQKVFDIVWNEGKSTAKITSFQEEVLKRVSSLYKEDKHGLVVTAPTGVGKTKLMGLISAIFVISHRPIMLCFPRKSLVRQELEAILKTVHELNRRLSNLKIRVIVDDGSTPREHGIRDEQGFRSLSCPICGYPLKYRKHGDRFYVYCTKDGCSFNRYVTPFLYATKDSIEKFSNNLKNETYIYLTNAYCLERRILDPNYWNILEKISMIVLDEAHVYSGYLGGHVHFVLRKFQWLNKNSKFILASATITRPEEFGKKLLAREDVECIDYEKETRNSTEGIRRLITCLYVLPHPEISVDTVVENLVVLLRSWCETFNHQAIVFIDSIKTINRLHGYIREVICERRELKELFYLIQNNYIDREIAGYYTDNLDKEYARRIIEKFYKGIEVSHTKITYRDIVEEEFRKGLIKILLSTSTIELGLNIDNVAVVLQHSFPLTPEAFIQRVGRAGRTRDTAYISLGIMVLPHTTLGVRFVHDENFRKRLYERSQTIDMGDSIIFQHTITSGVFLLLRELTGRER